MATIKFENGQTVNFEGDPTPEDIDFVAQQIGIKSSASPTTDQSASKSSIFGKGISAINPYAGNQNPVTDVKDAFQSGIGQIKKGFSQGQMGNSPLQGLEGGANIAAGAVNTALSPLAPIFAPIGRAVNAVSDKVSDIPAVQRFAQTKTGGNVARGAELAGNLSTVAGAVAGGAESPKITRNVITDTTSFAKNAKTAIQSSLERSPERLLKDASESIYPKLNPTERASIQLKDTGSIFKKSVPDLINDPKTKPIVESVANLPEDLRLKPSDSIAVKDSKLSQGISRLHQDTSNYLYEQTKSTASKFSDRLYNDFMNEKVLKPVIREYGVDSIEVQAMKDNISTGKGLIKTPDAYGVYNARQQFQSVMKQNYPNAFKQQPGSLGAMLDPRINARLEMARAYRTSLNDFISEELMTKNDPYRFRLKEESNLIKAGEQMRQRSADDVGRNNISRFLNRNPKTKAVVNFGKGALKIGTGIDFMNHL